MRKPIIVLLLLAGIGCSGNSDEAQQQPEEKTTVPGVGSTFQMVYSHNGIDNPVEIAILRTGLDTLGKSNISDFKIVGDHPLFAYEKNGDISSYNFREHGHWLTTPLATMKPVTETLDSLGKSDGTYQLVGYIIRPFAPRDVTINGKVIKGEEFEWIDTRVSHFANGEIDPEFTSYDTSYITWSRELGFWTYLRGPDEAEGHFALTGYTLK